MIVTLIRLEAQKTDIVVSINVPHVAGEYEAGSVNLESGKVGGLIEEAIQIRERVLGTFLVKEWGLFVVD
jgi:hypothetical protein